MGMNYYLVTQMLQYLRDHHGRPNRFDAQFSHAPDYSLTVFYLNEHELIKCNFTTSVTKAKIVNVTITGKGIDLLEPSGGLSALMNTGTIRFESDMIRQVMETAIHALRTAPEKKEMLLSSIRDLPAEGLKHIMLRLIELGIQKNPEVVQYLLSP